MNNMFQKMKRCLLALHVQTAKEEGTLIRQINQLFFYTRLELQVMTTTYIDILLV